MARRREGCGLIAHLSNQLGSAAGAAASAAATVLVTAAAVSGLSRIAASASKLLVPASKSMAERPVRPPATIAGLDEIVWNPIEYAAHATMNVMTPVRGALPGEISWFLGFAREGEPVFAAQEGKMPRSQTASALGGGLGQLAGGGALALLGFGSGSLVRLLLRGEVGVRGSRLLHHLEAVLPNIALGALVVSGECVEVSTIDVAAVDANHGLTVRLGDATAEATEKSLGGDWSATGNAHGASGGLHGCPTDENDIGSDTCTEHLVSLAIGARRREANDMWIQAGLALSRCVSCARVLRVLVWPDSRPAVWT